VIAGRYHLRREVGRGGMGAVWLAHDQVLDRDVALKRIGSRPGGGDDPDLQRALREARLTATLSHSHVVAVFDLVDEHDQQWLVMEYVDGETLAQLVRREGPMSPDRAAGLLVQAADALAAAHEAGIVHRDVKPSNILVTGAGLVKLSDFGIARATGDASLTRTGMVVGSPAYLSPEVASGRPASAASDVWSLGATTYFALTGTPAYDADNVIGTLYRIVNEDPPRPDGAGWLAPLLEGTMAVDPDARWTMSQVRAFLRADGGGARAPTALAAPVPDQTADPVTDPLTPGSVDPDPAATRPMAAVAPSSIRRRLIGSRRPRAVIGAAAVLLALLTAVVVGALQARDEEPSGLGASASGQSHSITSGPTAAGMEAFVRQYLHTVTEDPATAWQLLTPEFQERSGSYGDYRRAWQARTVADLSNIVADADDLTVSYDVAYADRKGRPLFDDSVTLSLEFRDGDYLIAGED